MVLPTIVAFVILLSCVVGLPVLLLESSKRRIERQLLRRLKPDLQTIRSELHTLLNSLPDPDQHEKSGADIPAAVETIRELTTFLDRLQSATQDFAERTAPLDYRTEARCVIRDQCRVWRIQLDIARHALELWRGGQLADGVWHSVFAAATALEPQFFDAQMLRWTRYLFLASIAKLRVSRSRPESEWKVELRLVKEGLGLFEKGSPDWLSDVPASLVRAVDVTPGDIKSSARFIQELCAT